MAVHEDLPGIEVTVCANGQALKEHDTDDDESQHADPNVRLHEARWTVTKYVESITGANFAIKCAIRRNCAIHCPQISFATCVDGEEVCEPLLNREMIRSTGGEVDVTGELAYQNGRSVLRKLKFSTIETSSDGSPGRFNDDTERISRIGEIMVKVFRCGDPRSVKAGTSEKFNLPTNGASSKVHEKALKGDAKSHGVSLGAPEPATYVGNDCEALDGDDYPIAIFKFNYRSNEDLKQLHIIERTPEPEPGLFDGLTAEQRIEVQDFAQRIRKRSSDNSQVKQEEGKEEARRKRLRLSGPAITIDLTDEESPLVDATHPDHVDTVDLTED